MKQPALDLRIMRKGVLESAVETLRNAIVIGHFKPGERLVEAEMCAAIGISRASLREALRRLQAERLVDIIPNRGPVIPVMTWSGAEEIFQVRLLLEPEAAALAARHGTPAHHARARAGLAAFAIALAAHDMGQLISATAQMYEAITDAAGNGVIQELQRGLHARISFLRAQSMSANNRAATSLQEMTAMLDAIEAGQEAQARAATQAHILAARAAAKAAYECVHPSPAP